MKVIGGAIVLLVAIWLYVVSTKMLNRDKEKSDSGCSGSCSGCANTGCASYQNNDKE